MINLNNTFRIVFNFQRTIFQGEIIVYSNSGFPVFSNLYNMYKTKKALRNKFLSTVIWLTEEARTDPDFTFFILYVISSLPFTHVDELVEIVNFLNN